MLLASASPTLVIAGERRPESPQSVNEAWAAAALLAGAVLPAHATDDGVIDFGSNINPPPPEVSWRRVCHGRGGRGEQIRSRPNQPARGRLAQLGEAAKLPPGISIRRS